MFPDSFWVFSINRFYFHISFWGGVCTANSFHAWLLHCLCLFIVIFYSISSTQTGRRWWGHHAMSAPLRMVRQVRDSCSVFHSSSLQPADLQKGHRAPGLNEQLHSRVRHLEFFCLFMSSNKGEEKNCVGMKCVRVAHICSPILYSLSSFHASVAF